MPAAFDRCVQHVKGKGEIDNPYAVCRASMGTDAQINARHRKEGPIARKLRRARDRGASGR